MNSCSTTSVLYATKYECGVYFDALHLICHAFDFAHAFVILYLLVVYAIKNNLNLNLNVMHAGQSDQSVDVS